MRRLAIVCVLGCEYPLLGLVFYALGPIIPDLARVFDKLGETAFIAQVIVTVPALGIMIGGWLAGTLVDRFGGRRVQVLSFAVFALAGSAGLYISNVDLLLISRFLTGLAAACIATSNLALLGALFDPVTRARLIGRINGIGSVLDMVGLLLVGQFAKPFPRHADWMATPVDFHDRRTKSVCGGLLQGAVNHTCVERVEPQKIA